MISDLFSKIIFKYYPKFYKFKKIRGESYLKILYKFNFKLKSLPNFPRNVEKIFDLDINNDYVDGDLGYVQLKSGEVFCGKIAESFHIQQFNFIKDRLKKKILKENYLVALDIAKRYMAMHWLCKKENEIFKKNHGVFIEVGSYLSHKAIKISKKYLNHAESKILCFEMSQENFRIANKNIELNNCDNVKNFNLAVSNSNTILEYNSKGRQRNSLENIKNTSGGLKKKVKSVKLDSVIENEQIRKIDFIYITVNGSEHKVLEGLSNNIKKVSKILIVSQYINESFDQSVRFLKENNFTVEIIKKTNIYGENKFF